MNSQPKVSKHCWQRTTSGPANED